MDKRRLMRLILIPIVMGLVVTLAVKQVTSAPATPAQGAAGELVPVVVIAAKEPVPGRTPLTEAQLAVKKVPKEYLTGREFSAVADVVGQTTLVQLEPGEIVLNSRVVAEGKGTMPYRIPHGTRAMTIRIDELTGVAGYPAPGDAVDLVLVLPGKAPDHPATTGRILYEAVPVLAKGPAETQKAAGGTAEPPKLTSLTLALKPEQAVEVALAEQIGIIKVMLRPAVAEPNAGPVTLSETPYWKAAGTSGGTASTGPVKP